MNKSLTPMVTSRRWAPRSCSPSPACGDDDESTADADDRRPPRHRRPPRRRQAPRRRPPAARHPPPARASRSPSTRGPDRRSTPTSPRSCSRRELGHAGRVRRDRRVRHLAGHGGRLDRRRARGVAVGSRRRLRDLHHPEPDRGRPRPARTRGQDRLVRADLRRRGASRARHVGGLQGSRAGRACSPPPSRAISASS